ncbi:MAG: type III-B CRISPR module RAMP protein Cmr1 [candidate division WOR-3 bacterium]
MEIKKYYSFRILTPLAMGGANRNLEFRIPSIKGMLRWWFRFYYAGMVNDLKELRENEDKTFGSTERSCPFYLRVIYYPEKRKYYKPLKRLVYLPDQEFTLLFESPFMYDNWSQHLENSLRFLSLFGGLGARWRRGFGSVEVKGFEWRGRDLDSLGNFANNIISFPITSISQGFMNISNTGVYIVKPRNGFWQNWEKAIYGLRNDFYTKIKGFLNVRSISYKPPKGQRNVSPVVIQIKRTDNGKYFGVVLVYNGWNRLNDFKNALKYLDTLEIKKL